MRAQKSVLALLLVVLGGAALCCNYYLNKTPTERSTQMASEQSRETLDTHLDTNALAIEASADERPSALPEVDVVLVIHAGNLNKNRRDAIRESWMQDANKLPLKLVVKFFIGTANETAEEKARWGIAEEAEKYGDIVMLDTVRDAYQTIMHKGREAFRWYVEHYRFRFLLKTDDDCYMNLRLIPEIIAPFPRQNSWGGFFMAGPVVFGHHKSAENHLKGKIAHYPKYASGALILFSPDIVKFLATLPLKVAPFVNDDAAWGLLLVTFDIKMIDIARVFPWPQYAFTNGCIRPDKLFVLHSVPQIDPTGGFMRVIHANSTANKNICDFHTPGIGDDSAYAGLSPVQACHKMKRDHGVVPGQTYGTLEYKKDWANLNCNELVLLPEHPSSNAAPGDGDAYAGLSPSQACHKMKRDHGVVPGQTWGTLENKKDWTAMKCDELVKLPEDPSTPGMLSPSQACHKMKRDHGVVPGQTWGTLENKTDWTAMKCDELVKLPEAVPAAA